MPRQLPWLNKGRGSKTQAKPAPKPSVRPRSQDNLSDIDDDFFAGTILESTRKRKEKITEPQESDDELPELPTNYARASHKTKDSIRASRMPSSSPPPTSQDLPPPQIEYMQKAVDKFDLRDDEWMMVEDEFLQTAKLFTRHLHLAEYERLRKSIEEKKEKEAVRPVVPDAKPSVERQMKMRVEEQAKAQKKTLKDVFSSVKSGANTPKQASSSKVSLAPRTSLKPPPAQRQLVGGSETDSDDLDAPKRSSKAPSNPPKAAAPAFTKPSLPSKARLANSRPSRVVAWDDYTPKSASNLSQSSTTFTTQQAPSPTKSSRTLPSQRSTSPTKPSQPSISQRSSSPTKPSQPSNRPSRSIDLFDDLDFPKRDTLSKDRNERLTKRKADKEKEEKRKSIKLNDIPTFLF